MRGLYNAAGSMLVNQVRLENVSNNIANLNTPGYKRTEVVTIPFPEIPLYRTQKANYPFVPDGAHRFFTHGYAYGPIGIAAENVAVEEVIAIHISGAPRMTERPLDIAIHEPGFFVVETPDGPAYTRDGHLQLSDDGMLVSARGYPVLGEGGHIYLTMEQPFIDDAGNIYQEGEFVDKLQIVNFADDVPFWKDGYNLFRADDDTLAERVEATTVSQGYLEESNSDLSRQMTDMIKATRAYEASQRVAQIYDRMLSRAANDLGSLG